MEYHYEVGSAEYLENKRTFTERSEQVAQKWQRRLEGERYPPTGT